MFRYPRTRVWLVCFAYLCTIFFKVVCNILYVDSIDLVCA
uniref:Uncharacterized protein n=1 Tax=Populus trichocarpa TaxID=3694 RepID=A9PHN1_POPTR|nr:unknown [Populus trichocarpa]